VKSNAYRQLKKDKMMFESKSSYVSLDATYSAICYGFGYPAMAMHCLIILFIFKHTPKAMRIYSRLLLHSTAIFHTIFLAYSTKCTDSIPSINSQRAIMSRKKRELSDFLIN
jgi:hypothetical protein